MNDKSNEALLEQMRRRFSAAAEGEREIRDQAKQDYRFAAGYQWDEKDLKDREQSGRPAIVHNRLVAFCNQVTNEARQQKPQVRFSPVENADDDTAEVYEDLARHIQYDSRASIAYETAVDHQVIGGFGYFRLLTDYCEPESFDQDLRIEPITDAFSVYGLLIPTIRSQKPRFAFVIDTMTRDDYEAAFGETDSIKSFDEGDDYQGWITADEVRVAEYWYVESRRKKIAQLASGDVVDAKDVPEGTPIVKLREIEQDVVRWIKTNGATILEETEWVGSTIPIYPVLGKSLIVDGKPELFSLVRFMRDPQKLINYTKSRIAESLAVAPISPWIVAEGQLAGRESMWASANVRLWPYLEYKPMFIGGGAAPAPQRQVYEPPIAALSAFLMQEIEELKAISGLYDPVMGDNPANQSGIAIQRQQQQGATTNMHYLDNLTRAHEMCGRSLAEAIPKVYDTPRMIRTLGADEAPKVVKVNQQYQDENGQAKHYPLNAGKYDITVTTGRAYSTKKIETFDTLSQLVQAKPELMQLIGDIIFRNSDMAGADEIADRLKKMLPPQLADDEGKQGPDPQQLIGQLQQQGQMVQQLTAALNQLKQEQESKSIEIDSRERIAAMQEETKRTIALATLNQNEGLKLLESELAAVRHKVDVVHQATMKAADQQHQAEQAELGRQAQAEQAEQQQSQQDGDEMPQAA